MPVSEFYDTDVDIGDGSMNYHDYEQKARNKDILSGLSDSHSISSTSEETRSVEERTLNGYVNTRDRSTTTTEIPPRERKILLMLSCLYLQFSSIGMTISLGVIYVSLIEAFNAPRSEAALIQSLYMGISIGGGILFSRIISRFDVGKCVICTSVLGTICLIVSSFAINLAMIIVLIGIVLGLLQSFNLLTSYAVINWTFAEYRKPALAFLTLGQAVSQFCLPFITEALVERYSWNGGFLVLSAFMTLQCVPIGLMVYFSSRYFTKVDPNESQQDGKDIPLYKDFRFILFLTSVASFAGLGPVEQWFTVDLAVMKGFTTAEGATLLSMNGIFGLLGRVSGVFILHRFARLPPEIFSAVSFLVWAVAHAWLVSTMMYWFMVIAMVLRGFSAGIVVATLPAMQIELRGVHKYTQSVAINNLLAGSSQIIGGFLGGYTADVTGSYDLIFYLASGSSIYSSLCMVVGLVLRKWKTRSNDYEKIVS